MSRSQSIYFPFFSCRLLAFLRLCDVHTGSRTTHLHTQARVNGSTSSTKHTYAIRVTHNVRNTTIQFLDLDTHRIHSAHTVHRSLLIKIGEKTSTVSFFCDPVKDYDVIHSIPVECGNISHIKMRRPKTYVYRLLLRDGSLASMATVTAATAAAAAAVQDVEDAIKKKRKREYMTKRFEFRTEKYYRFRSFGNMRRRKKSQRRRAQCISPN